MTLTRLEELLWDEQRKQADARHEAERRIIILRTMLRERDPSFPDVFDGKAWAAFERGRRLEHMEKTDG